MTARSHHACRLREDRDQIRERVLVDDVGAVRRVIAARGGRVVR